MVAYRGLFLLSLLKIVVGDIDILLNPAKRCVATSTQAGPCHMCMCTTRGVFHCRSVRCDSEALESASRNKECDPHHTYRHDTIICSCNGLGQWRSPKCKENFNSIQPTSNQHAPKITTDIACIPGQFYVIDCNICICGDSEILNLESCTNRPCIHKYKVDACNPGDVLRTENEICVCSDINNFIDRLCLKVADEVVQKVKTNDLDKLISIGSYWDALKPDQCKPYYYYIIDCAKCQCSRNETLKCDGEHCKRPERPKNLDYEEEYLRSDLMKHRFYSLPELGNINSECEPGLKYRFKCNSCMCNNVREPVCTTMICMDEIKLTVNDLKQMSSYKINRD